MLDHIAIAVKNPKDFIDIFQKIGFEYKNKEVVESEGVIIHFLIKENLRIELLEPLNENSKILNFISKRGETFHHIAFSVKNISKEIENLKEKGFEFINEEPKKGAEGKKISFINPKSSKGVLIEIVEVECEHK
jgi:methylmalonyl-CoA/ethylmalonyl-CoA epimerase